MRIINPQGIFFRQSVISTFEYLADKKKQLARVDPNFAHAFSDSLEGTFYTLFDIGEFDLNTRDKVGMYLYDEEEADAIHEYCVFLLELLNEKIGGDKPDSAYIDNPEWPKVIEGAKQIVDLMKRKNQENGFDEFWNKIESGEINIEDEGGS